MWANAALLLQLLAAHPVTNAYAAQVKHDVVVSVTFGVTRPSKVCAFLYAIDDETMDRSTDAHCWVPKNDVGSLDVWPNMRLDEGNWKVTVTYPDHETDTVYLVARVNS